MVASTSRLAAAQGVAELDDMARHIDQLPLLPQVLVRIMQLRAASDDYFDQVSALARVDPPFAVRLLAVANSSSSAPASPIRSIRDALTRIGATTITDLIGSLAVQRVFMPSCPSQLALWRHSIRVAVAAQTLARLVPALRLDADEVYLAGLLHDIGRFVMFEHAPGRLLEVDETHWHSPQELVAADVEVFKFTHSELGFRACRHWGLPQALAETVRRHHEELDGIARPGSLEAGILCVEVADMLDVMIIENVAMDGADAAGLADAIERLCLRCAASRHYFDARALAATVADVRERSATLLGVLGLA